MARPLRYVAGLVLIGLVGLVAGYGLVLPHLGRSVEPVAVSGLAGDAARGAYLAVAAGCLTCHTDYKKKGKLLAGGPAIETPFGTFYGPNITPDDEHGIGGWTVEQLSKALTAGRAPDGAHYFPSFPYTSYAAMRAQDIVDLKAFLDTVAPIAQPSRAHDLSWPFSDRTMLGAWKVVNFNPDRNVDLTRGAYLVDVLGHCGECHTQRDMLGGKIGLPLAGNTNGPGGAKVPGLRRLMADGVAWSADNITLSLQVGMKPNGDFLGDTMAEVVEHSTGKLRDEDRAAIATHLLGLR